MELKPQTALITDIPAHQIDALANDHKAMGADKIEVIKQSDGRFSLKVTYSPAALA
jgi:hypothetical protein